MNKHLAAIINEFEILISSQPPYGDYFTGDIIKWIEIKLDKEDIRDRTLLRKCFLITSQNYIVKNQGSLNENVLNALRVCDHFEDRFKPLKINQKFDDAQLITIFRIIQKKYNFFDNKDEEIIDFLYEAFGLGIDNITKYYTRKKDSTIKWPKKLFKIDWNEL
jgi:hypothetical protein